MKILLSYRLLLMQVAYSEEVKPWFEALEDIHLEPTGILHLTSEYLQDIVHLQLGLE